MVTGLPEPIPGVILAQFCSAIEHLKDGPIPPVELQAIAYRLGQGTLRDGVLCEPFVKRLSVPEPVPVCRFQHRGYMPVDERTQLVPLNRFVRLARLVLGRYFRQSFPFLLVHWIAPLGTSRIVLVPVV